MFKKTEAHQSDLFASMTSYLGGRRQSKMQDSNAWHNVFTRQFLAKIDEEPYSALYDNENGRPNASIRTLIAMMVLKEGNGWTDRQLFEQCDFNVLVMRALGFTDFDQQAPTPATYYNFRSRLAQYQTDTEVDLIYETFKDITSKQVEEFGLAGRTLRLDSKLLRSNIALGNRVQLIAEAVRVHLRSHTFLFTAAQLSEEQLKIVEQLQAKSTANLVYQLGSAEQEQLMVDLGYIIASMIAERGAEQLPLLVRLFSEQYKPTADDNEQSASELSNDESNEEAGDKQTTDTEAAPQIELRDAKQVPSGSLQSVHDPDATYTTKGKGLAKKTVSGYHGNITETCDEEDQLNLITEASLETANVSEDEFLCPALESSQEVLRNATHDKVETIVTDGGYDSIENREKMADPQQPEWQLAKLKGRKLVFDIRKNANGDYEVLHIESGEKARVTYIYEKEKYRIQYGEANNRYMTKEQLENYIIALALMSGQEERAPGIRASVESTIHQVFCKLGKYSKVAYRGLIKCRWYVTGRALWTNLTRIKDHGIATSKKLENGLKLG